MKCILESILGGHVLRKEQPEVATGCIINANGPKPERPIVGGTEGRSIVLRVLLNKRLSRHRRMTCREAGGTTCVEWRRC